MTAAFKHTLTFPVTDGPKYLERFEVEGGGGRITLRLVKRNGYDAAEAVIDAETFFGLIDKIRID